MNRKNAATFLTLLLCASTQLASGQNVAHAPSGTPTVAVLDAGHATATSATSPAPVFRSKVTQIVEAGKYPFPDWTMEILVSATYAADGRWADLDQDEATARVMVATSLRVMGVPKQPAPGAAAGICRFAQLLLMAQHIGSFDEIAAQPPFSPFVESNLRRLAEVYATAGDEGLRTEWAKMFAPGWEAHRTADAPKLGGGAGDSPETAIHFAHAVTDRQATALEYDYVSYLLGRRKKEWNLGTQSLSGPDANGRRFDILNINLSAGGQKTFYFDITDTFGKQPELSGKP